MDLGTAGDWQENTGLTFEKLNLFRVQDLLKFLVRRYIRNDEATEIRQATQADFDRW